MLYINLAAVSVAGFPTQPPRILPWHVGEPFPCKPDEISMVEYIQADEDEMREVIRLFGITIPSTPLRVQAWYGDLARSIVFALSLTR